MLEESGTSRELQGWASVENRSGATYEDAKLKLIAGTIHRAPVARPMPYAMDARMFKAEGASAQVEERGFFEYHLYELPQRATLANNEVKQVGLMHATGIKAVRKFTYDGAVDQDHVQVRMEFQNDAASGLGMPLPEGIIRAFQRDTDGSLELVGEDRIQHTPKNQTVRVAVGDAFDIAAERKQTDVRQISGKVNEISYEILLTNHRKEAVDVTVIEHAPQITESLGQTEHLRRAGTLLSEEVLSSAFHGVSAQFDEERGGLGGAPKFPQPMIWEFVLRFAGISRAPSRS